MLATGGLGLALAHLAPSALILPTFLPRPPRRLGTLCRWAGPPVDRVALTFDDGPSEDTTVTMRILGDLGLHATFFVLGEQVVRFRGLIQELAAEGHEIATHGWSHRSALGTPPWAIATELRRAIDLHADLLGTRPRFYRPPYGHISSGTLVAARRLGLELVLWSCWGKEWAERDVGVVVDRVAAALRPGSIILLHDNDVSCRPGTAALTHAALRQLPVVLDGRGLRAASLAELLGADSSNPRWRLVPVSAAGEDVALGAASRVAT